MNKLIAALLPLPLFALEVEPWFSQPWECHLISAYTYSRFTHVQNAHPQIRHPFNDQMVSFALGTACGPSWAFDTEIEFVNTPVQRWGYRSFAAQGRYLWCDDIIGDPVSFATGLNIRAVSSHSLEDVSCPYHSYGNFELTGSLGKEWGRESLWVVRTFGFGGIGMANRGAPWMRLLASIEGNYDNRHRLAVFSLGYFGFGHKQTVDPDHFHGYANIAHRSIDLGAKYSYVFNIWGDLSLTYVYRPYAHAFPAHVNFITLSYNLPFSFF